MVAGDVIRYDRLKVDYWCFIDTVDRLVYTAVDSFLGSVRAVRPLTLFTQVSDRLRE